MLDKFGNDKLCSSSSEKVDLAEGKLGKHVKRETPCSYCGESFDFLLRDADGAAVCLKCSRAQ